jgi:8-oxo-dGTP diphosphatase
MPDTDTREASRQGEEVVAVAPEGRVYRQEDDYDRGMPPYDPSAFPPFAVTVDLVVLTVRRHALCTLVVRRGEAPYQGRWALPGGFVRADEDLGAAAARELVEETGLCAHDPAAPPPVPSNGAHLEQLATYGAPDRDPRMRVVSVAHLALAPDLPAPRAGGDANSARWAPVEELLGQDMIAGTVASADAAEADEDPEGLGKSAGPEALAFDHARILADGVERARSKIEYSSLATAFCPPEFTVGELRRVYEAVWGVSLDPRNFHRKVTGTPGFLVPAGGTTTRQGGRPAQLFRAGGATLLNPPMLRPEV